jgi:hypothetical protein
MISSNAELMEMAVDLESSGRERSEGFMAFVVRNRVAPDIVPE